MTPDEAEVRWANRILRHLTMAELEQALFDRQRVRHETASRSAREQIDLAIERLETEIEGRRARAGG